MPFTLSHAAAALPFRRRRLVFSAVVVGTFAPDFEYLLRMTPGGGFGHTLAGAFLLSLPMALLVLWMFHGLVKRPLIRLFPDAIRLRLPPGEPFRFGGFWRFLLIAVSALVGIATHILWDSFTHPYTWPTRHWPLLLDFAHVPLLGWLPYYMVLQLASSAVGILILCAWAARWYQITKPGRDDGETAMPSAQRWLMAGCIAGVASLIAIARTIAAIGSMGRGMLISEGVVTAIALAWWLLVAYAIVVAVRRPSRSRVGV